MKIVGLQESGAEPEVVRGRPVAATGGTPPENRAKRSPPEAAEAARTTEYAREIERVAQAVRKHVHFRRTTVDISVDEELRRIVTKVLDAESGEVLRQYPPEAVLDVMKYLKEQKGILFHRKG